MLPGNVVLIGRKHYSDLRRTTMVDFFNICPPHWIRSYNKSEHEGYLINGSKFLFADLSDETKLRSLNLGAAHVDEAAQVPEASWHQLRARLRLSAVPRRRLRGVTNPGGREHYLYKQIVDPRTREEGCSYYQGSSLENRHNPADFRDDLQRAYTGTDAERFIGGAWIAYDGRHWPAFDPHLHVTRYEDLKRHIPFLTWWDLAIDFGFEHWFVCLFCAWDCRGSRPRLIVLREYFARKNTLRHHAAGISEIWRELRRDGAPQRWERAHGDWDNQDRHELASLEDASLRIRIQPAWKARVPGIRSMRAAFQPQADRIPLVFISDRCPLLIAQVEGYRKPENSSKDDAVVEFDETGQSIDDGPDALRYEWMSRVGETMFVPEVGYDPGMSELQRRELYRQNREALPEIEIA